MFKKLILFRSIYKFQFLFSFCYKNDYRKQKNVNKNVYFNYYESKYIVVKFLKSKKRIIQMNNFKSVFDNYYNLNYEKELIQLRHRFII